MELGACYFMEMKKWIILLYNVKYSGIFISIIFNFNHSVCVGSRIGMRMNFPTFQGNLSENYHMCSNGRGCYVDS